MKDQPSNIQVNVLWPDLGLIHITLKSKGATNLSKLALAFGQKQQHDKMKRWYDNEKEAEKEAQEREEPVEEDPKAEEEDPEKSWDDEEWLK